MKKTVKTFFFFLSLAFLNFYLDDTLWYLLIDQLTMHFYEKLFKKLIIFSFLIKFS